VRCLERGANDLHNMQIICTSLQTYYGPADATATPSSLAPVKSRMVYLSGTGLPRLSWKKGHSTDVEVVVVVVVVVRDGCKDGSRGTGEADPPLAS